MVDYIKIATSYAARNPLGVSLSIFVMTILALIVYAFFETKNTQDDHWDARKSKGSWSKFRVHRVWADPPSCDPSISYKNKLRAIVTNLSHDEISVWAPLWDSSSAVKSQPPLGAKLQRLGPKGLATNDGEKDNTGRDVEHDCLTVKPNESFRCWIGLLQPSEESIEMRITGKKNGILILPIKAREELWEARIEV